MLFRSFPRRAAEVRAQAEVCPPDRRFRDMMRGMSASGYYQGAVMSAISGIEMALWDIIGKSAGKPVYDLLGGRVRERLRSYTYLYEEPGDPVDVYHDPDLSTQRAVEAVAAGFTAIKFDPAGRYSTLDPRNPSVEALEVRYGFTSTIRETGGASMPTSVAASETSWLAAWPRAGGISVRNEISLIDRLGRSTWSPQVCSLPGP